MVLTRQLLEEREQEWLAPYPQKSRDSRGRIHPEPKHPLRTEFQRDRERVVHSPSFRRLEYKTQVFLNGTGDHYRTRLTHTIEVASVTRSVARSLRLNEDLSEAIEMLCDTDPEAGELVKLRYFVGLTIAQIAETMGISKRTADRIWAYAKAWLYRYINSE